MSNATGITGKLCNKCPKQQVIQNSSYSDFFNAISGFTSNSRAPGGPVTFRIFGKSDNIEKRQSFNRQNSIACEYMQILTVEK